MNPPETEQDEPVNGEAVPMTSFKEDEEVRTMRLHSIISLKYVFLHMYLDATISVCCG